MVDLPSVPLTGITTEAPKSSLSSSKIAEPYNLAASAYQHLGAGLDKIGEGLEKASVSFAEQAGYKAASIDDQGNLVVAKAPIIGPAAAAFARAVKFSALAQGEGAARREDIALSKQFRDNPEGYQAAASKFRDKMVKQYTDAAGPEVGLALGRSIDFSTTSSYRNLLNEHERLIKQRFDRSTSAQIASLDDDLASLAEGGASDPNHPEYSTFKKLLRDRIVLTHERENNPVLGIPKEQTQYELKQLDDKIEVSKFLGKLRNVIGSDPEGGYEKATRMVEAVQNDPSVPPSRRALFAKHGAAEIKAFAQASEKQDIVAKKVQKAKDLLSEDAIIRDSASDNPQITDKDIKNNPEMSPEAKMRMLAWRHRDGLPDPLAPISQRTSAELFRRMNLPDGDPNKINNLNAIREAYAPTDGSRGRLSRSDEEWLEKRFKEDRSPQGVALSAERTEFVKRFSTTIDGAFSLVTGNHSELGNQKIFEFQKDAARQEEMLRAKGEDPHSLYDPTSKNYLGRPEYLAKYRVSQQENTNYINSLNKLQKPPPGAAEPAKEKPAGIVDIPRGMTPAEAMKLYNSGTKIRLPDGRIGTVP